MIYEQRGGIIKIFQGEQCEENQQVQLINDRFMALQADRLLLDGAARKYHEFMSVRIIKTLFTLLNKHIVLNMLLGMTSLYQLMGRAVDIYGNYFRNCAGFLKEWLYIGIPKTHTPTHDKPILFGSLNTERNGTEFEGFPMRMGAKWIHLPCIYMSHSAT